MAESFPAAAEDAFIRVGPFRRGAPAAPPGGRASIFDLAGWTALRVQRSCEYYPAVFQISATERYPGDNRNAPVKPGDPCQVIFANGDRRDIVITGYVDQVIPSLEGDRHGLTLIGRSKCADLVDCSAIWPSAQFNHASVLDIARNLAAPFGIAVTQTSGEQRIIPQLVFFWGETPAQLIDRVARFAGLLVYDDANGDLVLGRVGTVEAASGFAEGANVERASIVYSSDQRFSEYTVRRLTFDPQRDAAADPEGDIVAVIPDAGVLRKRPKFIIAETPMGLGLDFARSRGEWEASRRYGRSTAIRLTADSWRDGAGNLWAPNTIVMVDLPSLKRGVAQDTVWVISTVTYVRDERGTRAELLIMPEHAFDILPLPLRPLLNDGPY